MDIQYLVITNYSGIWRLISTLHHVLITVLGNSHQLTHILYKTRCLASNYDWLVTQVFGLKPHRLDTRTKISGRNAWIIDETISLSSDSLLNILKKKLYLLATDIKHAFIRCAFSHFCFISLFFYFWWGIHVFVLFVLLRQKK